MSTILTERLAQMNKEIQLIVKMPIGTTGQFFEYEPPKNEGMYNLTELWRNLGSPNNKEPRQWARKPKTRILKNGQEATSKGPGWEFIESLCKSLDVGFTHVVKSLRPAKGDKAGSTWGHYQIYMAYLTYLSPEAQIKVNEIVLERMKEQANPGLAIDRGIKGYLDKGFSPEWIQERIEGKVVRNCFTSDLQKRGVTEWGYGACTNKIYKQVLGGDKTEIFRRLNLDDKAQTRDHLDTLQVTATKFAEKLAIHKMDMLDSHDNYTAMDACELAGKVTDEAIRKLTGTSCHVQPKALTN